MFLTILTPALVLLCWTLIMWVWMYATRIPAMQKAGIKPAELKEKSQLEVLPRSVRQIADNYNHLHEQPVVFYALVFYSHLVGVKTSVAITLAWAYVLLRIAHSLWQALVNFIPVRFVLFSLSSLALIALAVLNVFALLA
jgi:hypothetical protein